MPLHAGLVIRRPSAAAAVEAIVQAEEMGLPAAWSTGGGQSQESVTVFAAAAARTKRITLGTCIVPTYPRHPIVLASQAVVIDSLAPGRFHLGIGPSHRPTIEGTYGLNMDKPLGHLREYLTVLRGLLWEGKVDFDGTSVRAHAALPADVQPPRTPLPISALRTGSYRLAGEIADGAISWVSPIPYLVNTAKPAMQEGARAAGRPTPPLIGHVPVALHADRDAVRAAARKQLSNYGRLPFYASMFAAAGFSVSSDGVMSDALFDELVVSGEPAAVAERLQAIQAAGIDEIVITQVGVADPLAEEHGLIEILAREAA
jgi:F420-dependent oxidoreductase-like protein